MVRSLDGLNGLVQSGIVKLTTPCIIAPGGRTKSGHAMAYANGKRHGAHRAAWINAKGPIPAGMLVCHHCDNPPCINVDHLFLGTHSDNTRDAVRKGRWPKPTGGSKFTKEQIIAIRSSDLTSIKLGEVYGVDSSTIRRIRLFNTHNYAT